MKKKDLPTGGGGSLIPRVRDFPGSLDFPHTLQANAEIDCLKIGHDYVILYPFQVVNYWFVLSFYVSY
jgi:hypothetical protein